MLKVDIPESILVKFAKDWTTFPHVSKRTNKNVCLSCEELWAKSALKFSEPAPGAEANFFK